MERLKLSPSQTSYKKLYSQYEGLFVKHYAIDEGAWLLLSYLIQQNHVSTVLEFGSGLSTLLMDKIGVKVTAFEDFPEYLPKFDLTHSTITPYTGIERIEKVDLIFIDGPGSPVDREISFVLAIHSNSSIVVCHDTNLRPIKRYVLKYFHDWKVIGKVVSEFDNVVMAFMKKEN